MCRLLSAVFLSWMVLQLMLGPPLRAQTERASTASLTEGSADWRPQPIDLHQFPGGSKLFGTPGGCNGDIYAMAADPSGLIYLGGQFSACENVLAANVIAYDPASREFSALVGSEGNGTDGPVFALLVHNGLLYIGGNFPRAGGLGARGMVSWDGEEFALMSSGVNELVTTLIPDGDGILAGGFFTIAGGQLVNRVARWDGETWSALGKGINSNSSAVYALAHFGTDLYAGGRFILADTRLALNIARWDGSGWFAVGDGANDEVLAMVAGPDGLVVAGEFSEIDGQRASRIALLQGQDWQALAGPNGEGVDDRVDSLVRFNDELYVGGRFQVAGGKAASNIARWTGDDWFALGNEATQGTDEQVEALLVAGDELLVAGQFSQAGAEQVSRLAFWDGADWSALGVGAGNGVNGQIFAIAVRGEELFVGGDFSQAGGQPALNIARWNGSQWSALAGPAGNGVNERVRTLAVDSDNLYVGGFFTEAGGRPARRIARWDGQDWSALGSGLSDLAYTTLLHDGQLYVGGFFAQAGGNTVNFIARWDGQTWHALGEGMNDWVFALETDGELIYAGGRFTEASGAPARHLASWNGSTWIGIGTDINDGLNREVEALAYGNDLLYIGGDFFGIANEPVGYITSWDGENFVPVGGGVGSNVVALQLIGSDLYVGGIFNVASGQLANGLARWDGQQFEGLGTNLPPQRVFALGSDGQVLFVGGSGLLQTPLPQLQSSGIDGLPANGEAGDGQASRSGTLVVFASTASNLTADDNDSLSDIFLRDRLSGVIRRISLDALEAKGGDAYFDPSLSADGRTIAFSSSSGQIRTNAGGLGRTASSNAGGTPGNGTSERPMVLANGSGVVFDSTATDLIETDGNGEISDVWLKNLDDGSVELVSVAADGGPANGPSFGAWANADGSLVGFASLASNLVDSAASSQPRPKGVIAQAYLSQLQGLGRSGTILSRNLQSGELGNGDSGQVRITPDGRHAVFESQASNLVAGDSNGVSDIFYAALENGRAVSLERVSVSRFGFQANGPSRNPSISDDGDVISFETDADNLIELDRNGTTDILLRLRSTGEMVRLSRTIDGAQPDGPSGAAALAGDGGSVIFSSLAANLAEGDDNALADLFAVQLGDELDTAAIEAAPNYSYTWFEPEAPGWGYNLQQQGNLLYGTWYTYAEDGQVMFLTVEATPQADGSFTGPVYRVAGTPFQLIDNAPAFTAVSEVGSARMAFNADGSLSLAYTVNGVSQMRTLQRFVFDPAAPVCVNSFDSRIGADNYSDLWWNPAEAGWGLTLAHQGEVIFLLWYTYGEGGRDQWVSGAQLVRQPDGSFAGELQRPAEGVPLAQIMGPATSFPVPAAGTASLRFSDGENGVFTYTLDGFTQSKPIQRFVVVGRDQALPRCLVPAEG